MNFILNKLLKAWQWLAIRLQNSEKSMMLSLILILLIVISYVQPFYPEYRLSASLFFVATFLLFLAIIVINSYAVLSEHLLQSKQYFRFDNAYWELAHDLLSNARAGGHTSIQVISISGRKEWDLIYQQLFSDSGKLIFRGTLNIEFVLSDGHFLSNEDQKASANETFKVVEEINKVKKHYDQPSSRLTLQLHKIQHLPPIHGILISEKILYIGEYDWLPIKKRSTHIDENLRNEDVNQEDEVVQKVEAIKELAPTGTDFRRYLERRNKSAAMAVENFVCWFNYFVRQTNKIDSQPQKTKGQVPVTVPPEDKQPNSEPTEADKPFEHLDENPGTTDNPVE